MRQTALLLALVLAVMLSGCVPPDSGMEPDSPDPQTPLLSADIIVGEDRIRMEPGQVKQVPARPLSVILRSAEEVDWDGLEIQVTPETWELERRPGPDLQRIHTLQLKPKSDAAGTVSLTINGLIGPDGEALSLAFTLEATPAMSVESLAVLLRRGQATLLIDDLALRHELSDFERGQLAGAVRTAEHGHAVSPPAERDFALLLSEGSKHYKLQFQGSKRFIVIEGSEVETHFTQGDGALFQALQQAAANLLPASSAEAERVVGARAGEAVAALQAADMAKLAELVHPDLGVRFSPYAYVRADGDKADVVLRREQLRGAMNERTVFHWGHFDGTGRPITMQFEDYYKRFVYDVDFAEAPAVGYNQVLGRGNTLNNLFQVYAGAMVVEYHFPGFDEKFQGMDWKSLRLVFQEHEGAWYLVGIIHDQWTI